MFTLLKCLKILIIKGGGGGGKEKACHLWPQAGDGPQPGPAAQEQKAPAVSEPPTPFL